MEGIREGRAMVSTRNPAEFVHEYQGRFIVAEKRGATYYARQRPEIVKLTGCTVIYGSLEYVAGNAYSYARRSAALRRAKMMLG